MVILIKGDTMKTLNINDGLLTRAKNKMILLTLASCIALSSCTPIKSHVPDKERFPESVPSGLLDFNNQKSKVNPVAEKISVTDRLALSNQGAAQLYNFNAINQTLRVTLAQFAQLNNLNIIIDLDVAGTVNVEFKGVTFEAALNAILDPVGLGWIKEGEIIRVVRQITKVYQVNYLSTTRQDNSSIASSTSAGGASGSSSITKNGTVDFWTDLESELRSLLSPPQGSKMMSPVLETSTTDGDQMITPQNVNKMGGVYTINRITGTVQVTASPRVMKIVDIYLKRIIKGINRQVYIEVKILDVTLTDDQSLGIDWSKVAATGGAGSFNIGTKNTITNAVGGGAVLPGTISLGYTRALAGVINIAAAIDALKEQGTVRVLSQPRIRAMNNQAAVIKVGTDRTFYTLETTVITPANGVPILTTTEIATQVTEGLVLTVTPQISPDGMVALDVMPVINKIIGVDTSPSGNSNSARVETKQASTMVRVKNHETAVIGGLIHEEDSATERSVPGFGDIPLFGNLFKGQYNNKIRRELVIFITPHII